MLDEIKSLPPLPSSIIQIQSLCMQQDTNIQALSRVIEGDPMLSANILKAVNSPLYGMSKEVSSISQAIMLFGLSMIRGFAAANAIKKALVADMSPYGKTIDDLADVSTLQSRLVQAWYKNVDKTMLPLLQSGAFLMELGKLIAARRIIAAGEFDNFLREVGAGKPISEIERCYLGISSYDIAGMMFEHWNFEPALIMALKGIGDPQSTNHYSQVLNVISKAISLQGPFREEGMRQAYEAIDEFGLDREAFDEALMSINK